MAKEYIERQRAIVDACNSLELYPSEYANLEDALNRIPAADVVEVVHAKWDDNGRCTNCGGHAPYYCMASTYYASPYCFECGAKMNKEEANE